MQNDYIRLSVDIDEEQSQKPQRRSLWRHWKMLSRFQRNLVTMVFVAVVVTLVYYWGLKEQIQLEQKKEELMNPQLLNPPLPQQLDPEVKSGLPKQIMPSQNVQLTLEDPDWAILHRPDLKPMYPDNAEEHSGERKYFDNGFRHKEPPHKEPPHREPPHREQTHREPPHREQTLRDKKLEQYSRNDMKKKLYQHREESKKHLQEKLETDKQDEEEGSPPLGWGEQYDRDGADEFADDDAREERGFSLDERHFNGSFGAHLPTFVQSTTLSPETIAKMKEDEERSRLEEEKRREQEERVREEQRRREEERQREIARKKEEDEKRREEERQSELQRMREEEEERQLEEKRKNEEHQKELARMTMIAEPSNIKQFRLKPVQFAPPSNERQAAVVGMLQHAWTGYKKYAWGHDHLKPISQSHHDWFGLGLTIVDGLDTLWIMGLKDEFNESREWVANHLSVSFNEYHDVNLFEVTIRVLGGLLSAYHLSGEPVFLDQAIGLGDRLLPCFTRSPSAIPFSDVNLASRLAHSPKWSPDSSTSEVTTLQLEFRDLSRCSHDFSYEDISFQTSQHVHTLEKTDGLVPIFINPQTGNFHENTEIKLGARGDSYYEYLLKQWIQTGKTINFLKEDYLKAIEGIQKRLMQRTPHKNLLFIGELKSNNREFLPKMDHLVCFVPGMLALGVHHGMPPEHMGLAVDLMETCYRTYAERPTFLAPEITFFYYKPGEEGTQDMYVKTNDAHNLLRPEFIESLWYMWAVTGNITYQDWGWQIFKAFERFTKVGDGYTSISNVNNPLDVRPRDMMESFFVSETIKYLYLLFSDDRKLIDIDKWVMNTEGHPLPIYAS